MNRPVSLVILSCLLFVGCLFVGCTGDSVVLNEPSNESAVDDSAAPSGEVDQPASAETGSTAGFALGPENTKIEFVGTHVGNPNPRTGGFKQFAGNVEYEADSMELKSVSVEIETNSIWTNVAGDGLTRHLQTEDFFDVRQFPSAKFSSTSITKSGGPDQYEITGDFTLLATTKEISFPATASVSDGNVALTGDFTIDRTEWGMDRLQDRVEKDVSLTVVIGEKTEPRVAEGGGGRRGGRGGFDPVARFKEMDANEDGKLAGDEISERMQDRMETLDGDSDGELTLEEFQEGMRRMFAGRGGPGGGQGRTETPNEE